PAYYIKQSATEVRPGTVDVSDPDETCTGTGSICTADMVKPSSFECRASAGVCDTAESCTGVATQACPADVFKPSATVCRPGSGDVCDPDETCTGTGASCPAVGREPSRERWRASAGVGDMEERSIGVANQADPAEGLKA